MNAHRLMLGDGTQIDLTESKFIKRSLPKQSQLQKLKKEMSSHQIKDLLGNPGLSKSPVSAVTLDPESQIQHTLSVKKQSRMQSQARKMSQQSPANASMDKKGNKPIFLRQIESQKFQDSWQINQSVTVVNQGGDNYRSHNRRSVINSPSAFSRGSSVKGIYLPQLSAPRNREINNSSLLSPMNLSRATPKHDQSLIPIYKDPYDLSLNDRAPATNSGTINLSSRRHTVDAGANPILQGAETDLLNEKREEIQRIIRKRQRKAAIASAAKQADIYQKPTLQSFVARRDQVKSMTSDSNGNEALLMQQYCPEDYESEEFEENQRAPDGLKEPPANMQSEIFKLEEQALIQSNLKKEKRLGSPVLATSKRAQAERIKDVREKAGDTNSAQFTLKKETPKDLQRKAILIEDSGVREQSKPSTSMKHSVPASKATSPVLTRSHSFESIVDSDSKGDASDLQNIQNMPIPKEDQPKTTVLSLESPKLSPRAQTLSRLQKEKQERQKKLDKLKLKKIRAHRSPNNSNLSSKNVSPRLSLAQQQSMDGRTSPLEPGSAAMIQKTNSRRLNDFIDQQFQDFEDSKPHENQASNSDDTLTVDGSVGAGFDTQKSFFSIQSKSSLAKRFSRAIRNKATEAFAKRMTVIPTKVLMMENSTRIDTVPSEDETSQEDKGSQINSEVPEDEDEDIESQSSDRSIGGVKKDMQIKLDMIEKDEKEQQELCGKRFVKKIDKMIELITQTGSEQAKEESTLPVTNPLSALQGRKQAMKDFIKTGNSSAFSMQQNKNSNEDQYAAAMVAYSQQVKQQAAFYGLTKQVENPRHNENENIDVKVKFFKECQKDYVLAYPLLHKIVDQTLLIRNKVLNHGLCKAIKGGLKMVPAMLVKLTLDTNSLTGQNCALLITGLTHQTQFKALTIKDNEVDEKCVDALIGLLKRRPPENLEELHLIECKIGWKTTLDLLTIMRQRCYLKKLSLIKASLNEFSIKVLAEALQSMRQLTELDISWNQLQPKQFLFLLEKLGKKRLQNLNLAWNSLVDQNASKEDQDAVLLYLGKLIKHSRTLQHLNLTSTGLTSYMVHEMGTYLKRSRALLVLHLSNNPGLSDDNRDYLVKRIIARPNEDTAFFTRVQSHLKTAIKSLPLEMIEGIQSRIKRETDHSNGNPDSIGVSDKLIFQRILGHKEEQPGTGQWYESSNIAVPVMQHYKHNCWICEGHTYSLLFWSRGLAFKLRPIFSFEEGEAIRWEVDRMPINDPGLGFVVGNKNYDDLKDRIPLVCGTFTGWRYKEMIPLAEFTRKHDPDFKTPFESCQDKGLLRRRVETYEQTNDLEKLIVEAKTYQDELRYTYDWQKFTRNALRYKRPFIINGHEYKSLDQKIQSLEAGHDIDLGDRSDSDGSDTTERQLKREAAEKAQKKHEHQLKLRKQNQHLITPEQEAARKREEEQVAEVARLKRLVKSDTVFVLPFFSKPGKHVYMIKYKDSEEPVQKRTLRKRRKANSEEEKSNWQPKPETFFYRCQVPVRAEVIPQFSKDVTSQVVQRSFKKECSVFNPWRVDQPKMLKDMFEEDSLHWKLPRLIKDENDRENCENVFRKNLTKLKKIFINLVSQGSCFPNISQLDFSEFVAKCKLQGGALNLSTVDRAFIATNQGTDTNSLCRYQFWEILVRIAQNKFKDTGKAANFSEALEKLINDYVMVHYPIEDWQEFRDQQLWKIEVNDVFEANIEMLKKIYYSYHSQVKKWMDLTDCINLCTRDCNLGISEKDINFAYGMSKMTVVNEQKSSQQYMKMVLVEFLEFIGRLSFLKFKNTSDGVNLTLAQKIEFVLDDILAGFGLVRIDVNIEIQEFSESDDDY